MFRRAMKRAVQNTMRAGAKGIKVEVSGRLGGAEIARTLLLYRMTMQLCVQKQLTVRLVLKFGFSVARF